MSERGFRRRIPSIGRRTKPPQPASSPHRRTLTHRRLKKPSKPVRVLQRCTSEPILWTVSLSLDGDNNQNLESDGVLFRPLTCTDVLATSSFCSSFLSLPPQNQEVKSTVIRLNHLSLPKSMKSMVSISEISGLQFVNSISLLETTRIEIVDNPFGLFFFLCCLCEDQDFVGSWESKTC